MEEKTIPFAPVTGVKALVTAKEFLENFPSEQTVTMEFSQRVLLTLQNHQRVLFEPGVHEVPASIADHGYLKGRARIYDFKALADKSEAEAKALRQKADELEKKADYAKKKVTPEKSDDGKKDGNGKKAK